MSKKRIVSILSIIVPVFVVFAAILAGYNISKARTEKKYEMEVFRIRMSWFGSVSEVKLDLNLEEVWKEYKENGYEIIDDPVVIRNIQQWENEGIAGWTNADRGELDRIMERVETDKHADGNNFYSEQVIEDARKLIYGGYDILGEADMLRFIIAVQAINHQGFSVQLNWSAYLRDVLQ